MDDVTKAYRRKRKAEVIEYLQSEGKEELLRLKSILNSADKRILQYCLNVIADPDSHNLFELLGLKRFIRFMDKYEFRISAVKAVILVIESLRFPSQKGLTTLTLSSVQVFALAFIYGFYKPDGRRLIRNALLFVPRKFGKTTLVAGIAIYELLFGDADGQVYACANSYQQAKICFDNIRNCLKALDRTGNRFRVNREVIFNDMKGRSSFARCLASDPSTLDGLSASCYILDEYSQAKSAELRNVMSTSTGIRQSPLEVIITTASDVLDGPCVGTLEAYQRILLEEAEDDSVFALIFIPDVDDNEANPRTWRKVQPHIGVTIQEDYYAEKWLKAQQSAEDMLAFRTKLLNVFAVNESKSWITGDEIRDLYKPFTFEQLAQTDSTPPFCAVSFDLSVWDDFSAVTYEIYRPASNSFHFHTDYYLPEGSLEKHSRVDLYKEWVRKGYLNLLPGKTINYELIVQDIIKRNGQVLICSIGYDPYHSKTAVNMLQAYGAGNVMHAVKQTYGAFTGAVETLETMIKNKVCTFTPNEITAWCFGNCQMDEDKNGNRKPIKKTHNEKIDGAITCLMCQDLFNNFKR